jgi:hypothetical protein
MIGIPTKAKDKEGKTQLHTKGTQTDRPTQQCKLYATLPNHHKHRHYSP